MRHYMDYWNRRNKNYGVGMKPGCYAHIRGWDAGAMVTVYGDKGERDSFTVTMTGGSNGGTPNLFLGTVHDTEDGARWVPADSFLSSIPGRVGSPSMEVVAAIPYGTEGREFKCVVIPGSQRDMVNPAYGVVSAYRNSDDDNRWYSTGGHYDLTLARAIRVMAERAGAIVRPSSQAVNELRELMGEFRADAARYSDPLSSDMERLFELMDAVLDETAS